MALTGTCTAQIGKNICGERVGEKTKFCASCNTPEKRKANEEAQRKLEQERK